MKKIGLLFLLGVSIGIHLRAQTLAEWFDQKKTQTKYLASQIAALSVYVKTLEKGYQVAASGLGAIGAIKRRDFNLHEGYFTSLRNVNPRIKAYWKVADMLAQQMTLLKNQSKHQSVISSSGQLNNAEVSYIKTVYASLFNGCTDILDQLTQLLSGDSLSLTDDERIKGIDTLHAELKNNYQFEQDFFSRAYLLAIARAKEAKEVSVLKNINAIQ